MTPIERLPWTITVRHNADISYSGQDTRTGDNQRVWIDGESSASMRPRPSMTLLLLSTPRFPASTDCPLMADSLRQ